MHPKHHQELLSNVAMGKGYRFSQIGGSFLSGNVKRIGKKIAKKGSDKVLDYIGEKTGQRGATNFIKDEVADHLIDFGADIMSGGSGGMPKKGTHEMRDRMTM
jgi:hypothetical protein